MTEVHHDLLGYMMAWEATLGPSLTRRYFCNQPEKVRTPLPQHRLQVEMSFARSCSTQRDGATSGFSRTATWSVNETQLFTGS